MQYLKFDTYILGLGFSSSKVDHYVYSKLVGDHFIYVVLYFDDMLLIGNNMEIIKNSIQLSSKFDMKYLGDVNFLLGMEIKRDWVRKKLLFNQRKCVKTILHRFNMQECKPVTVLTLVGVKFSTQTEEEVKDVSHVPYAIVVGSLTYAMVYTTLAIACAVKILSRYMSKLGKGHWTTTKRVFKYLHCTSDYAFCYQGRLSSHREINI